MFPIMSAFISQSKEFLASTSDAREVASRSIKLLKGNGINCLSAHEFTFWLGEVQGYLETALKVKEMAADIRSLLVAELKFRFYTVQMPVFKAYGKISSGRIIEQPQITLLSRESIAQLIIREEGKEGSWDENRSVAEIVQSKDDLLNEPEQIEPYGRVKKLFNAKPPNEYTVIETQNDAHLLNRYLAGLMPIVWEDYLYCETRAQAACEYLEGFHIDPHTLLYARVKADETNRLYENWSYHQAVAIKTKDEGIFILDPATDREKALSPSEWSKKHGEKLTVHYEPALEDLRGWFYGRYGSPVTAFAIARGANLPYLQELVDDNHPLLKEIVAHHVTQNRY